MFLPEKAGGLQLTACFGSTRFSPFSCHILMRSSTAWAMRLPPVLRNQLAFLQTGLGPNDYTDLREFLINE